jgi:hypothetical protein
MKPSDDDCSVGEIVAWIIAAFMMAMLLALASEFIQGARADEPPASVRSACMGDAIRLCGRYLLNPSGMEACMREPKNLRRISKGCMSAYWKWKHGK